MKTTLRFLSFALLMTLTLTLAAQVRISPKAGINLSLVDASLPDFDTEARAGWNVGVDARLGKGMIFLQPGLHYLNYTADLLEYESADFDLREQTTIQSLKAPLNLGIRLFGDNGLIGLHVRGGIVPTYVLGVKEADNFAFSADRLNRLTWGANAGVGLDLLIFTADISYEHGLTDFFKDTTGGNNVLTMSVGFKF